MWNKYNASNKYEYYYIIVVFPDLRSVIRSTRTTIKKYKYFWILLHDWIMIS